jgi:broad specificity phosphatase PhoE
MKTIEVRRHSIRDHASQDLSEQGVTLARLIGAEIGPFHYVVTSTVPRAHQTAVAMGFQVDEQVELLNTYGDAVEAEVPWPADFSEYAAPIRRGGAPARYAQRLKEFFTHLAENLPDPGAALVVTHGGVVEIGAVACLPEATHDAWGDYIECLEGVRLFWEDGKFVKAEVLRI